MLFGLYMRKWYLRENSCLRCWSLCICCSRRTYRQMIRAVLDTGEIIRVIFQRSSCFVRMARSVRNVPARQRRLLPLFQLLSQPTLRYRFLAHPPVLLMHRLVTATMPARVLQGLSSVIMHVSRMRSIVRRSMVQMQFMIPAAMLVRVPLDIPGIRMDRHV